MAGMIPRSDPESSAILEDLQQLLLDPAHAERAPIVADMLRSLARFLRDEPDRGDLKMLNRALKELRYAFKVFTPYRMVRKVSIFGSARTKPEEPEYAQASHFANRMSRRGWMVITGAGSGIMEAAQGGAGRNHSFGVNIRLPFEQKANEYIAEDPKLVNFKYFFTRKVIFLKETHGIALFPGGFGTHDESFESLTLIQTGKTDILPVVFVDKPGGSYWLDWKEYVRSHLEKRGMIDPNDLDLFEVTDDPRRAVEVITGFYHNYHSSRFVRDLLVVRLHRPVSDELLDRLNTDFSDVLKSGKFERADVHPDEANDPHTHRLHRLRFDFDRRSYGRLRRLIDVLNEAG